MAGPLRTEFEGGPWDGQVRLGRLRPEPLGMGAPLDASGPERYEVPSAGGAYQRTTPDRAVADVYCWHDDEEQAA